jgi:hypothetical protein
MINFSYVALHLKVASVRALFRLTITQDQVLF